MRRTLTALLALLLTAAGLLAAGAGYLAGTEDDVELTHHLIAGDPAAAQGITLTLPAGDQQAQTCWETTVALGTEMLSPETAFTFYPGGKDWEGSIQPGAEIYTGSFSYGISASGSIDFADYLGEGEEPPRRHDATLMVLPAADVAERTEDGETRTETLRLADYYDYFPVAVELTLPEGDGRYDRLYTTWAESRALTEYFGLTVPEDLMVEVSATRDAYGNVTQVDCREAENQRFWADLQALVVEGGVCLAYTVGADDVRETETPEGVRDFGLYFLPFSQELQDGYELGDRVFDLERIRLFCPLSGGSDPLLLDRREEGQLLLFAREDGALKLSVFDVDTWQCVQWESIFPLGAEDYYSLLGSGEGFMVMYRSDDGFFQVVEEQDGVYTPALSGTRDRGEGYVDEWWHDTACAYDGERLVLSGITGNGNCSLWVQVYDETGLTYGARIDHSLDREDAWNFYEYRTEAVAEEAPLIAFTGD